MTVAILLCSCGSGGDSKQPDWRVPEVPPQDPVETYKEPLVHTYEVDVRDCPPGWEPVVLQTDLAEEVPYLREWAVCSRPQGTPNTYLRNGSGIPWVLHEPVDTAAPIGWESIAELIPAGSQFDQAHAQLFTETISPSYAGAFLLPGDKALVNLPVTEVAWSVNEGLTAAWAASDLVMDEVQRQGVKAVVLGMPDNSVRRVFAACASGWYSYSSSRAQLTEDKSETADFLIHLLTATSAASGCGDEMRRPMPPVSGVPSQGSPNASTVMYDDALAKLSKNAGAVDDWAGRLAKYWKLSSAISPRW